MRRSLSVRARASLAAAVITAASAGARADTSACGPAATVRVEIAPGIDPATARRVVEQVLAEVSPSAEGDCAAPSKTHIEVHWIARRRVHLVVTAEGAAAAERAERDLDLSAVTADGRLLAIAIAADELLTEARARLRLAEARAPAGPAPTATATAPPPRPARRARIDLGFGPALAMDVVGKDVLLGPDARLSLWVTPHLSFSVRGGLRAGAAGFGAEPWAAAVVGARALVSPIAWDTRRGAAISLGADMLALRTGSSLAIRAVPSAGLAGWMRVAPSFVLVGDVGLGAALGGARRDGGPAFALSASLGFAVPF